MKKSVSLFLLTFMLAVPAEAAVKHCTISVVGGSWEGATFDLKMENGKFIDTSGVRDSPLQGCAAMKYVYGRWYHLCKGGKIAVFKQDDGKWRRLKPKSERKYVHNCL